MAFYSMIESALGLVEHVRFDPPNGNLLIIG